LVGQVAGLALDIEKYDFKSTDMNLERNAVYDQALEETEDLAGTSQPPSSTTGIDRTSAVMESAETRGRLAGADITGSIRVKIDEVLGSWEEPNTDEHRDEAIPISSIIQFRQSLSYLNTAFPFGVAYGLADTREHMVDNAEKVYQRLLRSHPDKLVLNFDTFALLAIQDDGTLDVGLLKELVGLFRPQRDGSLSLLDFAKSVDSVYKDLRMLRASVANSTKLDGAFEKIVNIGFYFVLGCIVLSLFGVDPLVLFASVSGFVLGFAFMIGSAASKYFEGLLLIFVRRPFNIGDFINVSDVNNDTPGTGSAPWLVKDISLFSKYLWICESIRLASYQHSLTCFPRLLLLLLRVLQPPP
jgi:Mechanosensitive ion channel